MPTIPPHVAADIRNAATGVTARRREVLVARMEDAVVAYRRGRYPDALRLARQVSIQAPGVAPVHELAGLSAYRSGRWREAIRQLEAHELQTGSVEHLPVIMDCYRAIGRHAKVAKIWSELRRTSPDAEVLAEARMVAAGSLADRGDLQGAISMLVAGGASKAVRNPGDRHLRQWYALGDLYERAGDIPRARELFTRVHRTDTEAYDVEERLRALGQRPRTPRARNRPPAPSAKAATT